MKSTVLKIPSKAVSKALVMALLPALAAAVPAAAQAQAAPVQAAPDAASARPMTSMVPPDAGRWSNARAWKWYQSQPWPCGFNYIPAHSISYTEMWMPYNFDIQKIDAELALAQRDGFNCARVVLPFVVWEHDPKAFKARFSQFLGVCARRGIKVMPALFDDCVFGDIIDPVYGRQPVVVPGWYANGWTPSPGHSMVRNRAQWPRLERYVRDMISTFKSDNRVWVWDLYNEPSVGDMTVPLVSLVFDWARQINPSQPLTCDVFGSYGLQRLAFERSDIVTFHNYDDEAALQKTIDTLGLSGRPLICTEWLNRSQKSAPQNCLPVFARANVGAMHWGLVNGRTQTNLRWGAKPGQPTPKLWQHDLYRSEFTVESLPAGGYWFGTAYDAQAARFRPYSTQDLALFRSTIKSVALKPRPSSPARKWLLPTAAANDASNVWRYSTDAPAAGWESAAFNDAAWKSGTAGFGTDAPNSWPRTLWSTPEIWIRRSFEVAQVPARLELWVHHDEMAEVYLNGHKVWESTAWTESYSRIELDASALKYLQPGANLIAVHCRQTAGGQYIDVGLAVPSAG